MRRAARLSDRRGRRAETIAVLWLRLFGWNILERRLRTPGIEIDIIARRGDVIAFVEVKYRPTIAQALTAITPDALRRLRLAVGQVGPRYAVRSNRPATIRLDLLALAPFSFPRHVANIGML
ncbi:YraN family protein [Sandaracinobacteroides saxicola]|uniref:UPF0102 protein H3309_13930 n=1 Tax=Sandaracinobacteroides saxicola TaxID=2759707 RepID=A0A7G5IGD6_9SPHN|nr:YraN family protein [Sandaracinobacteroides saxicola]QMW22428.1 YraN family protein [Sandaracinobacteroides saxicola]